MSSARALVWVVATVALIALMASSVRGTSPVMDELVGPAIGVAELRDGDTGFRDVHPPLARHLLALPLLGSALRLPFDSTRCGGDVSATTCANTAAIGAFYAPGIANPDALLTRARAVNWVLAVLAMLVTASIARKAAGARAEALVFLLFLTSPVWISNGAVATIDIPYTAMCVGASAALTIFRRDGSRPAFAAFIACCAAAALAKFAALPWLAGLGLVFARDAFARREPYETLFGGRVKGALAVIAGAFVAGLATFAIIGAYAALVPAHALVDSFRMMLARVNDGHGAYLFGEISKFGWWWYFPTAWALKSPMGTTLAATVAIVLFARSRTLSGYTETKTGRMDLAPFWIPALVFAALALTSKVNIGVRYLLPLYPAIFLGIAVVLARAVEGELAAEDVGAKRHFGQRIETLSANRRGATVLLIAFVLALNLVEMIMIHPRELSFVTTAVGGPANAARYLSDSNVDWGQDLPSLRREMERVGATSVILGWFGVAPPEAYGVRYQPLVSYLRARNPDESPNDPVPDWLAVSLSFTTGQYVPELLWLRDRAPDARAGWSIGLYEIRRDALAHRRLADLYEHRGFPLTAARHRERAAQIESAPPN